MKFNEMLKKPEKVEICDHCGNACGRKHRKWPTPEQFREEYGAEYPDDGAVYVWEYVPYPYNDSKYQWVINNYLFLKILPLKDKIIICACTPWGKPPDDWRSE